MSAVLSFSPAKPAGVSISDLVAARIQAKRAEDVAVEARRAIDVKIAESLRDPAKQEGTVSSAAGDYKVSVTYKIDRKVDTDALQAAWAGMSAEAQSAFKWKADVSVSAFRKLEGKAADAAAAFIESKPASPSIKIEAA